MDIIKSTLPKEANEDLKQRPEPGWGGPSFTVGPFLAGHYLLLLTLKASNFWTILLYMSHDLINLQVKRNFRDGKGRRIH